MITRYTLARSLCNERDHIAQVNDNDEVTRGAAGTWETVRARVTRFNIHNIRYAAQGLRLLIFDTEYLL